MNSYGVTFFNPTLFTTNKQPMKFYLDGYNNHEVNEIARIIEAFGGKLSTPDENTIIFSEPGRPVTTDHCRYHIKCLHDSIVAKQFQDLEQYRILAIKEEFIKSSDNGIMAPDQQLSDISFNTNPSPSLLKPWKIVSVSSYADMDDKHRVESLDQLSESDTSLWSAGADSESSEFNNNERVKKKMTGKLKAHSSSSECKNLEQETKTLKRKRAVDQYYSDTSNEENALPIKKRRSFSLTITEQRQDSLRKVFLDRLQYDVANYINDPKILQKFQYLRPQIS